MKILTGICCFFLVVFAYTTFAYGAVINKNVENNLLKGRWDKVIGAFHSSKTFSAVEALILAHSYLALNRHNEALGLFLSVEMDGLLQWESYSHELLLQHPNSSFALFLAGDSLARLGQFEEAIGLFSKALAFDKDNSLILNARGVCFAAKRDFLRAREDFSFAIKGKPKLADAFCNYGSLFIHQGSGDPVVALKYFEKALEIAPDSTLALNGRACAKTMLGNFEGAIADFDRIARYSDIPLIEIFAVNRKIMEIVQSPELLFSGESPGMEIERLRKTGTQDEIAWLKGTLINNSNWSKNSILFMPPIEVDFKHSLNISGDLNIFGPIKTGKASSSYDLKLDIKSEKINTTFDMNFNAGLTSLGNSKLIIIPEFSGKMDISQNGSFTPQKDAIKHLENYNNSLNLLNSISDVKPSKLNPFESFVTSQFNSSYSFLKNPSTQGGVTTEKLNLSSPDCWFQYTFYGIGYPVGL